MRAQSSSNSSSVRNVSKNRKILDSKIAEIVHLLALGVDFHTAKKDFIEKMGQHIEFQDITNFKQKEKRKANLDEKNLDDLNEQEVTK